MRKVILLFFFLLLLSLLAGYLLLVDALRWVEEERYLPQAVVVELERGMPLDSLSQELASVGLIDRPQTFRLWVRYYQDFRRFQAGRYRFVGMVSPAELAKTMMAGESYQPVVLRFAIPEGFTVRHLISRLAEAEVASKEELQELAEDPNFLAELSVPSSSLEGFLFPATYSFTIMPDARTALSGPVKTFWRRLPIDYQEQVGEMGLSLAQAVAFASLIELETPQEDEKPLISEVIWRRLKANMPLGIDAAVIYGITDFDGVIRNHHLADRNNPYNNRIHRGLPPTPIGSPSLSSLLAVLNPADEGNYYFVVDPDNPGRHVFARSLSEHNKNVRRYVHALREQRRNASKLAQH